MRIGCMCGALVLAAGCARSPEPTGPATGQRITMNLESAEITEVDFDEARGELRFHVRNTRTLPVELDRVEWRMTVAGDTVEGRTYIGAIPSGFDDAMVAQIRVPWSQVDDALEAHPSRNYMAYTLEGEGIFKTATGEVRRAFTGQGTMPVLHPPMLSLEEIRLRSMDPQARTAAVDLVMSAEGSQIRSVRNAGLQLHIGGHEVARLARGQSWTELSDLVVPVQLDLSEVHPTEIERLSSEGQVDTVLMLQGIADTVHGEVDMSLRAEDQVQVVGRPRL